MKKAHAIIVSFLLLGHTVLAISAALRLSPTWDEISYPVSGAVALETRSLSYYPFNPFLSRLMSGIPALLVTPRQRSINTSVDAPSAGFEWLYRTVKHPRWALFLTRLPFILLSVVAAFLIFWVAAQLWGPAGGVISLVTYLSIPIFVSRASLALLEMPMYAAVMGALAFNHRWLTHRRWADLAGLAVCSAAAALSKLTALPFVGVMALSMSLDRSQRRSAPLYVFFAALVFLAGYAIWKDGFAAMKASFSDLFQFNKQIPFYWRGRYQENASSLLTWGAWAVKAPPVPLALFAWSMMPYQDRIRSIEVRPYLLLIAVYLALPFFFSAPVSTVQLSPLYLGVVVLVGALGAIWDHGTEKSIYVLTGLLTLGFIDVARVHPNYLGYFNQFTGGPSHGAYWLADSDQDWGQSLPSLATAVRRRPKGIVVLSYSGAGDPEAHGVPYIDLISAALVSRVHKNPPMPENGSGRVYLAVGTKMDQITPEFFDWLDQNRRPLKVIDGTFRLYDLSKDPDALRWLARCFEFLNRNEQAGWFNREAGLAEMS